MKRLPLHHRKQNKITTPLSTLHERYFLHVVDELRPRPHKSRCLFLLTFLLDLSSQWREPKFQWWSIDVTVQSPSHATHVTLPSSRCCCDFSPATFFFTGPQPSTNHQPERYIIYNCDTFLLGENLTHFQVKQTLVLEKWILNMISTPKNAITSHPTSPCR